MISVSPHYFVFLVLLLNSVCDASDNKAESPCNLCRNIVEAAKANPSVCKLECPSWGISGCAVFCPVFEYAIATYHQDPCAVSGICGGIFHRSQVLPPPETPPEEPKTRDYSPACQDQMEYLLELRKDTNALLGLIKDVSNYKLHSEKPKEVKDRNSSRYLIGSYPTPFCVFLAVATLANNLVTTTIGNDKRMLDVVNIVFITILVAFGMINLRENCYFLFIFGIHPLEPQVYASILEQNQRYMSDADYAWLIAGFLGSAMSFLLKRRNQVAGQYLGKPRDMVIFKDIAMIWTIVFSSTYCITETILLFVGYLLPEIFFWAFPGLLDPLGVLCCLFRIRLFVELDFGDSFLSFVFYVLLCCAEIFQGGWEVRIAVWDFYTYTTKFDPPRNPVIPQEKRVPPNLPAQTGQVPPPQGKTGQVPPSQGKTGQVPPPQGKTGQVPPSQGKTGQVPPPQGKTGQVAPPLGKSVVTPFQGKTVRRPPPPGRGQLPPGLERLDDFLAE